MLTASLVLIALLATPDESLVESDPVQSANGHYSAIVRWTMKDLGVETTTVTLYRDGAIAGAFSMPQPVTTDMLVSDSGKYVVWVQVPHGCTTSYTASDPVVAIYRSDGSLIREVMFNDIVSDLDAARISSLRRIEYGLRFESDTREVVVVSIPGPSGTVEQRIDLQTAAPLDEKKPLFPPLRVGIESTGSARPAAPPECAGSDAVKLDGEAFLARAMYTPVPEYTPLAIRARVSGHVRVTALIDEMGRVICTRHSSFPFFLDRAADAAVQLWRFRPMSVDGHRVRYYGEVTINFENPDQSR